MTNYPQNKKKPPKRAIFTLFFLAFVFFSPVEAYTAHPAMLDDGSVLHFLDDDYNSIDTIAVYTRGSWVYEWFNDNVVAIGGYYSRFQVLDVSTGVSYFTHDPSGWTTRRRVGVVGNVAYSDYGDGLRVYDLPTNTYNNVSGITGSYRGLASLGGGALIGDGNYIYGRSGDTIYKLDHEGNETVHKVMDVVAGWNYYIPEKGLLFWYDDPNNVLHIYDENTGGQVSTVYNVKTSGDLEAFHHDDDYLYAFSSTGLARISLYGLAMVDKTVLWSHPGYQRIMATAVVANGSAYVGIREPANGDYDYFYKKFTYNDEISAWESFTFPFCKIEGEYHMHGTITIPPEEIEATFELLDVSSITDESARLRGRITSVDPEEVYSITFYIGKTSNINEMWFSQTFLKYGEEAIGYYSHFVSPLDPGTEYFYTMRVNNDYAPVESFFTASAWPPPEEEWPEAPEEDPGFFNYYDEHSDEEFLAPLPVFATIGGFMGEMFGLISPLRDYFHGLVSSGEAYSQGEIAGEIIPTIRGFLLELDPFFGGVPVSVAVVIFILLQFLMLGLKIIKTIFALIPFV